MCCILCEEPVRSITLGLAAVGIVTLVNGARALLKRRSDQNEATRQVHAPASDILTSDTAL